MLIALGTIALQRRFRLVERYSSVLGAPREGADDYSDQEDFAADKNAGLDLAFQVSEAPDWRKSITLDGSREPVGFRTLFKDVLFGFDRGQGLAELRSLARIKETYAATMAERCEQADQFHRAADELRFRLIGLGDDLRAASDALQKALDPFFVLSPSVPDWTQRDDLKDRLDPGRMAKHFNMM